MMKSTALMSTTIRFLRHSRVWLLSLWMIPTTGFYRVRPPTRSLGRTFVGSRTLLVARLRLQLAPMVGTQVRFGGLSRVRMMKLTALMLTSVRFYRIGMLKGTSLTYRTCIIPRHSRFYWTRLRVRFQRRSMLWRILRIQRCSTLRLVGIRVRRGSTLRCVPSARTHHPIRTATLGFNTIRAMVRLSRRAKRLL